MAEFPSSIELNDPRALRAYAHPTRLALIALLRRDGPLTATQAAAEIGESVAGCSFHLRQLAKYGLVEEAGGGRGREKPWRATAMFTDVPDVAADPEVAKAADEATAVIAGRYFAEIQEWLRVRSAEPLDWQRAALFGDLILYLTADELADLGRRMDDLLLEHIDRTADAALRPEEARPVTFVRIAFPSDTGS
jgi:DNA-binding transcriptional ArsR family regulator